MENKTESKKNKESIWKKVSVVLGVVLIFMLYQNFNSGNDVSGTAVDSKINQNTNNLMMSELIGNSAVLGNSNAPVTIIEWSDFECPYCASFHSLTFSSIEEEYINSGKVKFVYKHFPLDFHANAEKAAETSECAKDQNKFWEMHNLLFNSGVKGGVPAFKEYAKTLGLDTDRFNQCLDSGEKATGVKEDMQLGASIGIRGTPGFLINNQLVSGALPFEKFKQIIEGELAK